MIGLKVATEEDLVPQVIAYAIPPFKKGGGRTDPILRIKKVGAVYFVEGLQHTRATDGTLTADWKVLAVSKPDAKKNESLDDARAQAFGFMWQANAEAIEMSRKS